MPTSQLRLPCPVHFSPVHAQCLIAWPFLASQTSSAAYFAFPLCPSLPSLGT